MPRPRVIALALAAAALAAGAAGCGGSDEVVTQTVTTQATTAAPPTTEATTEATTEETPTTLTEATTEATTAADTTATAAADGSPEDSVRAYLQAFVDADGATACGYLTPEVRVALAERVSGTADEGACPSAFELAANELTPDQRAALGAGEVAPAQIDGATATTTFTVAGVSTPVTLELRDGRWLINTPPGQG
jgi:hypothetical protein